MFWTGNSSSVFAWNKSNEKKWDLFPFQFLMTVTSTKSSTNQQREQSRELSLRSNASWFPGPSFNWRLGPKLNQKIKSQQHEVEWLLVRENAFLENRWWPREPQTVLFVQQWEAAWWAAGLLSAAHFEAVCPFRSALFSGCLSLLIITGTLIDSHSHHE